MTQTARLDRPRSRPRLVIVTVALVIGIGASLLSACGSSSSTTATKAATTKPSYCSALTNLEQSVKALADVHPVKNGTKALESAVTQVKTDASTLIDEVKGQFSTQTEALKTSVNGLSSTAKEIASSPTAANLGQIPAAVAAVSSSVKNLAGAMAPTCG